MEQFGYKDPSMQVPKIEKITLNMGVGEAVGDQKIMEFAVNDLEKIAGQKPVVTKARSPWPAFKIRDGWPVGCKVTLRRERMYEFLDRLINIAIPRIRDFRGRVQKRVRWSRQLQYGRVQSRSSSRRSTTTRSMRCADGYHNHHVGEKRRRRTCAA